jgi:hypothetical protein
MNSEPKLQLISGLTFVGQGTLLKIKCIPKLHSRREIFRNRFHFWLSRDVVPFNAASRVQRLPNVIRPVLRKCWYFSVHHAIIFRTFRYVWRSKLRYNSIFSHYPVEANLVIIFVYRFWNGLSFDFSSRKLKSNGTVMRYWMSSMWLVPLADIDFDKVYLILIINNTNSEIVPNPSLEYPLKVTMLFSPG